MKSDRFWDELEVAEGEGEGGEEEEEEEEEEEKDEEEEETTQVSNSMNPPLSYPSSYPLPSYPPMPRERKGGERRIDKKSNKRQERVKESKMEAKRTEKWYLSLLHQWASLPSSFQQQLFFHYLLFLNHLQLILQLQCFDMFFQHSSVS